MPNLSTGWGIENISWASMTNILSAFKNCKNLKQITLAHGWAKIGQNLQDLASKLCTLTRQTEMLKWNKNYYILCLVFLLSCVQFISYYRGICRPVSASCSSLIQANIGEWTSGCLALQCLRIMLSFQTLSMAGLKLWNLLPSSVCSINSLI